MRLMRTKGTAAHGLFHTMQRVDTLLKDLGFLDLHRLSVRVVNEDFTHGLNPSCEVDRVEAVIREIMGQIPARVAELPGLPDWQAEYREGLAMELVAMLHQSLGLVGAYRQLPVTDQEDLPYVHTAEGILGHDPDNQHWLERACDWKPGEGPWA